MRLKTKRQKTAYHEAGHAILLVALNLECRSAEIVGGAKVWGSVKHSGGSPREESDEEAILIHAPEAYWLRLATAMYASAEAVRRAGYRNSREGTGGYHLPDSDFGKAGEYINRITTDSDCISHLCLLAKHRAKLLVKWYWPEIEAVTKELLKSREVKGIKLKRIFRESINRRNARIVAW